MQESLDLFTHAIVSLDNEIPSVISGHIAPYLVNYLYNHVDAICHDYAVCQIALGQENLQYFAREYLKKNPPSHPNIDCFGELFPSFLKEREELQDLRFIGDIAAIDRLFTYPSELKIKCGRGSLELWSKLRDDLDIPDQLYDEGEFELIYWSRDNDKDILSAYSL